MCPNEFAKIGRFLFLFLGILGVIHVMGPTATSSVFRADWWLDWNEILIFFGLSAVLFFAGRMQGEGRHILVIWIGWFFLIASVLGLRSGFILGVHVESPLEPIFFFVIGIWAHLSGLCKDRDERVGSPY